MTNSTLSPLLRVSATLLLVGQVLYVVVTLLHTGGDANNHPAIFAAYAASGSWTGVHVAQFACMALLIAGLLVLSFALDGETGGARWLGRLGADQLLDAVLVPGSQQTLKSEDRRQT